MQLNIIKVAIATSQIGIDTLVLTTNLKDVLGDSVVLTKEFRKGQAEEFIRRNYPSIGYTILE